MKIESLCFIQRPPEILLGLKKRGFGMGRLNGFGGKFKPGIDQSIKATAKRETEEECGLVIEISDLEKVGIIEYNFKDGSETKIVHIFKCSHFKGEPVETGEMRPEWFIAKKDKIPIENMWSSDLYWIDFLLQGKKFKGKFLYDQPSKPDRNAVVLEKFIEEVESFPNED
ncbi:MAG: 8-oxo-dGTP diphosphatase [Candidatus Paceibacterota bacterium]|jgi:8-oxo-dGTP diphosphatase/2-hydroxy-dATP diphosphatase